MKRNRIYYNNAANMCLLRRRRDRRIEAVIVWTLRAGAVAFLAVAAYLAATVEEGPCLGEETEHEMAWRLGQAEW